MNSNLKLYDSQFFTYGCFVNDINSCSLFSFMLTFIQTQILCNFMDLYIYISSSLCYCIHNKQYPQSCLSLSWGWGLGIGGSVLKWFTSYLSECYQSIKIASTVSDLCKLRFGVPQVSVLVPFIIFSVYNPP